MRGEREECGRDAVRGEGAVEGGEEVGAEVEEFLGELSWRVVSASCRCRTRMRAHLFCFAGLEQVEGAVGGDDVGMAQ